ncbi:MAG: hypothetical protein NTW29_16520 [Bacteroidetes bacterium]|nr:hypothetical protein [Bacteroidota bacterium]
MRKLLLSLAALCLFSTAAFSQAYEGIVEFDKKKQDAFLIDYSYSPEAVENAIVKKMEMLGYKPKEEKGLFNKDRGFKVFKGAFVNEVSADRLDYIIKVESKSRKNKEEAVVSLILLKDGVNAKSAFAAADMERVKDFLKNLRPNIEAADLEIQIRNQEEAIAKAEKKLSGLKSDKAELEKKLANNVSEQEATQKDIDNQRVALEILKGKRKKE